MLRLAFDRGTLRITGALPGDDLGLPGAVWDARTACHRAAAYRHAAIVEHAAASRVPIDDALAQPAPCPGWTTPPLRAYQIQALAAFAAFGRRGVVAMPTGSGKTRLAIAALASAAVPAVVLCPTRALLGQWARSLAEWYTGPVGVVGDGERRIEALTVMTFESAWRALDEIGDRFGMVVVDEVHHFGSGVRQEALEMLPARARLGLSATAPPRGSAAEERLADLVGPVVFELALEELVGTHLAPYDLVRLRVRLEPDEQADYERSYRPFREAYAALARAASAGATGRKSDFAAFASSLGRSEGGRAALRGFQRAVALASFPRAKRRLVRELLAQHHADKTLVFTAQADDAYAIAADALVPVVTADVARAEREEILDRFREGTYRAIVSAQVLNEGLDVPDASVALIAGGALGEREHVQRVGRVLRPAPGKRATIYTLVTGGTIDEKRAAARARARRHAARSAPLR